MLATSDLRKQSIAHPLAGQPAESLDASDSASFGEKPPHKTPPEKLVGVDGTDRAVLLFRTVDPRVEGSSPFGLAKAKALKPHCETPGLSLFKRPTTATGRAQTILRHRCRSLTILTASSDLSEAQRGPNMALPASVQAALKGLDKVEQKAFRKEFNQRSRSTFTGYLAWALLGWHYLYLGKVGLQFAFWFTGGFLVVGWLIDFFRLPGMIRQFNDDLARQLMVEHKALAS